MTKGELEQLRSLINEARHLQEELHSLPFTSDSVRGSMIEHPYIERTILIDGVDESRCVRLRKRLERKLADIQDEIERMEDWLDGVDDPEMRDILRMRYRNGLSWRRVAGELGYADESVVRKRYDRFLKMTEKSEM
ncbi:hypothetical protein [Bacilliculturomica massiliensis]|uniref:hypothetical protein n=1 Tax=Bacilliculturomica massiliensis TaxID=1917867 RepID=UPI001030DF0D|nr:hypothetical protein [Bacilliculturomica massiliensis]